MDCRVKFFVPVLPLALDTKKILDPGNYGFSLANGQDEPLEIKSVTLPAAISGME